MEEKIREELYSKLESEFDSYKKELETLTSKEIIDKSYETTMKEELMCLFYPESQRYDLDEIKALKNEKNSLETLYQGWMDSDLNINQLLEDNTDEIVAELAEEYKAKQSKKKSKGKVGNSMAYYQPEEIRKAKEMDLYTYLKNYEPDELVHFSRDTYMTRTHDSLKISNGMWYWFSRGIGGKTALEYLIQVREYTFIQAVETILGYSNDRPPVVYQQHKKVQNIRLILPKKSNTTDKVMSYLIGRGIDKDIISECIDNRLIYEDLPNHNVVFVGYDKNKVPRYAGVRATNNSRYMKDAYGSHKAFSFKLDSLEKSDTVHLFESAIDLLSYATLNKLENKEWYNDNLLSLAGVYQPAKKIDESKIPLALNYYLNQNQSIKKIYLHFDNDSAGRIATMALKTVLPKQYEVIDDPPKIGKDFNDFLCAKVGINYKKRYEKER